MLQIDTSTLSATELDLLYSIVGDNKKLFQITSEQKAIPVRAALRPYRLQVYTYCNTCELTNVQYFIMEESLDKTLLVSRKPILINPEDCAGLPLTQDHRQSKSCVFCERALLNFSAERLIEKLLREVRRSYE